MRYTPTQLDRQRSPFTGLTRSHWVESGEFLLAGVLAHVKEMDDPLVFPRRSGVAYPSPEAPWFTLRAQELEGLARTFLVAAPLLEENPALQIGGRSVRDYYAGQILSVCDPASPRFMGRADDIARASNGWPGQQLVEVAALCIGLMSARRAIWDRYTLAERAMIAACLHDQAHGKTHPHNWRFFNVLIGAFLQAHDHAVNERMMEGHLRALLAYYAGDGWYRDGVEFDYYSPWAFQFYGPLWCEWIGYRTRPEIAQVIEARHAELMTVYPYFFGRGGESLLWGRSAAYRCAASAPLTVAFRLRETPLDPGWARRIASGNLMQFIGREDLWVDGIPSLGFYGPNDLVVQGYSCAASPFWLAKIYQALSLPAESAFWTAEENEGVWPELGAQARTVSLPGPGLTATLHGATGAAECRPGKVGVGRPLTQRLAFNTAFPWEADDPAGGTAMNYTLCRLGGNAAPAVFAAPASIRYAGMRDGVLYRQIVFLGELPMPDVVIDLADIVVPGGVLRVDRLRADGAYELHLGHFGLPHADGAAPVIGEWDADGQSCMTVRGQERSLLLAAGSGWDRVAVRAHAGKSVEAGSSTVLHAVRRRESVAPEAEWLVALMLHRTDGYDWTREETEVVARLERQTNDRCVVHFKHGEQRTVDFSELEGRLAI